MKTIAIIQARLGSTRLPGKVMMDLGGMPVLGWVVRAAKAAKLVDQVWIATPDQQIVNWCFDRDIQAWLGSEHDVLSRFNDIAELEKPDLIVRLTADCPFLDPWLIDECIRLEADSTDYWPDGMDVQVFKPEALKNGHIEHVVNWYSPQLSNPCGNLRYLRLTVDTLADLELARQVAAKLKWPFEWADVVDALLEIKIAA